MKQSNNRAQAHKANVNTLTSKEEVEAYDYKTGYPDKESFTLTGLVKTNS